MEYFDISPKISESTPVFPGDTAFQREILMAFGKGQHLDLSTIKTTTHIGAHADAPSHYHKDGAGMDQRSLHYYMGTCQVIDVTHVGKRRILPADFDMGGLVKKRILFKTQTFPHAGPWENEFASLSGELIDALHARGVITVGIDTPSVDPSDSKDLPSHQALYRGNLAVLEGIDLDRVPAGVYQLVALPLNIEGADASPVRAVLTRGEWD